MNRLSAAIDVAAEYAYHLHHDDGLTKPQAIRIGVAAVVRAARSNPTRFVTARRPKDAGVGWSGASLMGAGSLLSAVGWIRNLVTGG